MIKTKISAYAQNFEEKVADFYKGQDCEYSLIYDACRYSLLLGGKRLRPFLMNSFYKLCGGSDDASLNFEAAIESIHTYSLIHDDLPCMDNDDMRRGKPSCHKKFGEGQVTKISTNDKSIHVMFSIGEKRFVYPDAFHMAFLEIN